MATRTGTPSQVNASAGNGSTSVTVPAGANGAIAFWAHWDGDGGSTLATLTLGGNAFTARSQIAEGFVGGESGVGVASLASLPAAGSQTLAWTWSAGAARSEGGEIVVVWIADMNVSDPFRDAKTDSGTGSGNVTVTVTTDVSDLLIAFAQRFAGGNPALDGTVFIDNATVNSETYDVSEVTPGAGSTVINMTGEDYSSMAAISLKSAGGGGGFQSAWTRNSNTVINATRAA